MLVHTGVGEGDGLPVRTLEIDGSVGVEELTPLDGGVTEGIDDVPTEDTGWAAQLVSDQAATSVHANHVTGLSARAMRHLAKRLGAN